jgi:hypothetical protein
VKRDAREACVMRVPEIRDAIIFLPFDAIFVLFH